MNPMLDAAQGATKLMTAAAGNVERAVHMANMPELWVVVLVVVPSIIFAVTMLYRREKGNLSPTSRVLLASIRIALFFLVFFLFFQPVVETTVFQVRKPTLAVLVDDSASMQRSDRYSDSATRRAIAELAGVSDQAVGETSRLDLVKAIFTRDEGKELERLSGENDLKLYSFGSEVREINPETLPELSAKGNATALGDALHGVLRQLRGQPVSGIVVLSDGRSNAGRAIEDAANEAQNRPSPVPIYAIGVGDPDEPRDVGIEEVDAPEIALVNDEIIFEVAVRSKGYSGQRIDVTLSEEGNPLTVESLVLEGENSEQNVLLYYRPTEPGTHEYEISIPVLPDEEYDENNRVTRTVNVIRRHINVLFVDGYPRWEYRYLKEALRRDNENVKMACLLLSADPDFVQETSRGVVPLTRFPRTREELFEYDVVLFGDVDPQDLTIGHRVGTGEGSALVTEMLENLRDFVEESSGGFGMIAGENDSPRSYRNGPIESILPVVIGDLSETPRRQLDTTQSTRLRLTDLGMASPIMVLEPDPEDNRRRWESDADDFGFGLPGFFWYASVKKAKPGAQVLATHPQHSNEYGPAPLIATQFYGSGRTFFTALDSSWRWRFQHGDEYFYRYWAQVIRFLAKGRLSQFNPRFEIYVDRERYVIGETVVVTAKVRDKNFEPSTEPTQEVVLQVPGSAEPVRITLESDPTRPGTYTQTLLADEVGTYRIRTRENGESETSQGRTVTFQVTIPSAEKENVSLDAGSLAMLGRRTDGSYLPLAKLDELADTITPLPEKVAGSQTREDLWDREWKLFGIPINWAIVLFAILICAEWIVRKRMRLL